VVAIDNNIYRKERIMEKRMLWFAVVVVVVSLFSSNALATTMGPPVAGLEAGKYSIGFDYSYNDWTLDMDGKTSASAQYFVGGTEVDSGAASDSFKEDLDLESNMFFANLGYGVTDQLEVFARLGMADLSDSGFSSDQKFAWGLGAKGTFYEQDALKWGALFQITWGTADDDVSIAVPDPFGPGDEDVDVSMDIDWYEIKVAVGPSYELAEGVSVYGGPFYHMISGDLDADASGQVDVAPGEVIKYNASMSADLDEASSFGGYVGAQAELAENLPCYVEYQFTGDANVFGAGLLYKF
jgi:opacity protein-like surface antigen